MIASNRGQDRLPLQGLTPMLGRNQEKKKSQSSIWASAGDHWKMIALKNHCCLSTREGILEDNHPKWMSPCNRPPFVWCFLIPSTKLCPLRGIYLNPCLSGLLCLPYWWRMWLWTCSTSHNSVKQILAFIYSRLDFCNVLLAGSTHGTLNTMYSEFS